MKIRDFFACPGCRVPLDWDAKLVCPSCGQRYLAPDDVPCFNDTGTYHGPIPPKAEMPGILELARTRGYRAVLHEHLAKTDPDLVRYITDPDRTRGLDLLDLRGGERVLDFGCAFGLFAATLARRAGLVSALDVTHEKLQFVSLMAQQDGLENLIPVCNGDPVNLPFPTGTFDWVILNAVFEYLPRSIAAATAREAHLRALREFHRVLAPRGRIYIATKNRFSYRALLGAPDHNHVRFASVLPRRVSRLIFPGKQQTLDRHVIHGLGEYRRLLAEAGFDGSRVYWPFPSLWYPRHFVSLTESRAKTLRDLRGLPAMARVKRALLTATAASGLLPRLVPHYIILATRC